MVLILNMRELKLSPCSIPEDVCLIITAEIGLYSLVSSWGSDNHIKSHTGKPAPGRGRFHIPSTVKSYTNKIQSEWKKSLNLSLSFMIRRNHSENGHIRLWNFKGAALNCYYIRKKKYIYIFIYSYWHTNLLKEESLIYAATSCTLEE